MLFFYLLSLIRVTGWLITKNLFFLFAAFVDPSIQLGSLLNRCKMRLSVSFAEQLLPKTGVNCFFRRGLQLRPVQNEEKQLRGAITVNQFQFYSLDTLQMWVGDWPPSGYIIFHSKVNKKIFYLKRFISSLQLVYLVCHVFCSEMLVFIFVTITP